MLFDAEVKWLSANGEASVFDVTPDSSTLPHVRLSMISFLKSICVSCGVASTDPLRVQTPMISESWRVPRLERSKREQAEDEAVASTQRNARSQGHEKIRVFLGRGTSKATT